MSDRAVVTLGAQVGGKNAHEATHKDILALRRLLAQECRGPYCAVFDEFALILRIDGPVQSWGKRGVHHVRLQRKLKYAKADIFVPVSAWNAGVPATFRQFLASQVEAAICVIAERARKAKVVVDLTSCFAMCSAPPRGFYVVHLPQSTIASWPSRDHRSGVHIMPTQPKKPSPSARCMRGPARSSFPNPWDAGSTRLLNAFGFEALATTSAGHAFALGRRDGDGGGRPRCDAGQCARHRRGDRPAGLRRPGERLRRCAGGLCRDHPRRVRGRPGRRLDRGCERRRRAADLRLHARGRAGRGGGGGGAVPAGAVRADRAGGEFPAWQASTSTTPSAACRRSSRPAPRCSMPRA